MFTTRCRDNERFLHRWLTIGVFFLFLWLPTQVFAVFSANICLHRQQVPTQPYFYLFTGVTGSETQIVREAKGLTQKLQFEGAASLTNASPTELAGCGEFKHEKL